MARPRYPLAWGDDPENSAGSSGSPEPSPAAPQYPLEYGNHTIGVPRTPAIVALRPTLLGGASPDAAFKEGDLHLAQAPDSPPNERNGSLPRRPAPSTPPSRKPSRQPAEAIDPEVAKREREKRSIEAKQDLNRLASEPLTYGPRDKQPVPADWAQRLPKATLDSLNRSTTRDGVPRELLARIVWQESGFDENGGVKKKNRGQGLAGLTLETIEDLKRQATTSKDPARLRELERFDRLKGPDAVDMASQYLRYCYDFTGGNWATAVAAYKHGPTAIRNWLNGAPDVKPKGKPWDEAKAYLRYVFQGDPGRFDRKQYPEVP